MIQIILLLILKNVVGDSMNNMGFKETIWNLIGRFVFSICDTHELYPLYFCTLGIIIAAIFICIVVTFICCCYIGPFFVIMYKGCKKNV